jgi:hypothetical protein
MLKFFSEKLVGFIRRIKFKAKPSLAGIRNYLKNKALGWPGVHEITGSDTETDVFIRISKEHKNRLDSALKSLTEREIFSTFRKESDDVKKGMRIVPEIFVKWLEECVEDGIKRSQAKPNTQKELRDQAAAELQTKTADKPLNL